MFKIGLVINPLAGIGGRVGLKGSDGKAIQDKALARGAQKLAQVKTKICFQQFSSYFEKIKIYTVSGEMGEQFCKDLHLNFEIVYDSKHPSSASDTKQAVEKLQHINLHLLLFAGGDGTARNIFESSDQQQTVLGIPAGVKIHSGVYAVSPEAAGLLVNQLISGAMLSLTSANVVDIDEEAFRQGQVKARHYGHLPVPASLEYVQAVKQGNQEVEELVFDDIAAEVIESMQDDIYYVIGSGSTCAVIMQELGLANTLLGSDIVFQGEIFKSDAVESDFLELLDSGKKLEFVLTVIGGQGHILGRGNQQISPTVIVKTGWNNFHIVASKSKLKGLNRNVLLVETGDLELDHQLFGLKSVTTGYHDQVLMTVDLTDSSRI
ncbi:MAG: ATP-NAD kinase family protein [Kangiellaceae bacterium]|nr:ATP-NAD kinase family protein [Kangiellaceae bacterium]